MPSSSYYTQPRDLIAFTLLLLLPSSENEVKILEIKINK